jgi:hypothetical protein
MDDPDAPRRHRHQVGKGRGRRVTQGQNIGWQLRQGAVRDLVPAGRPCRAGERASARLDHLDLDDGGRHSRRQVQEPLPQAGDVHRDGVLAEPEPRCDERGVDTQPRWIPQALLSWNGSDWHTCGNGDFAGASGLERWGNESGQNGPTWEATILPAVFRTVMRIKRCSPCQPSAVQPGMGRRTIAPPGR